ncbi:glycoside hydrolase family 3 protein [Actinomyces wuliandei]|uniref:glycoside hydrolase family 3 protein n=1 Tax=Actinomyces wuliandei TaxID=2057743 RepID=UPI001FAA46B2|nr:glycoside hydrolase family 3 C-terminal domain-containing protein [Actinomyces wuliandei]
MLLINLVRLFGRLGLLIMGAFGYVGGARVQTDQALIGINVVANLVPSVLAAVAIIPLLFCRLDRPMAERITADLEARRAAAEKGEDSGGAKDGRDFNTVSMSAQRLQGVVVGDTSGVENLLARRVASADLVVLALEEPSHLTEEAVSRADLRLPGNQVALVHAVAATGTPLAVVLVSGRPLVVEKRVDLTGAVLQAWHLGTTAPEVIADILTGTVTPSGRLSTGFPRYEGQVPAAYDAHETTGRPAATSGSWSGSPVTSARTGRLACRAFTSKYQDLEPRAQFLL